MAGPSLGVRLLQCDDVIDDVGDGGLGEREESVGKPGLRDGVRFGVERHRNKENENEVATIRSKSTGLPKYYLIQISSRLKSLLATAGQRERQGEPSWGCRY